MKDMEIMLLESDKVGNKILKIFSKKKSVFNNTNLDITLNWGHSWLKKDTKVSSFILFIIEFTFLNNININSIFK